MFCVVGREEVSRVLAGLIAGPCARKAVIVAMGVAYRSSTWLDLTMPLNVSSCMAVRVCCVRCLRSYMPWIRA